MSIDRKPNVSDTILAKWQKIIDLLARITGVPAALIMRAHSDTIEVFVSSETEGNPYTVGDSEHLRNELYCETVIAQRAMLLVPNALKDPEWDHNPDIKLNMIAYLGFPLLWPDNEIFGTICVLDNKENTYAIEHRELVQQFSEIVNDDLRLLYLGEMVEMRTTELQTELAERNRIEKALRESEIRYRAVVEDQTEFVCRFTPEKIITFANAAYCKNYEKDREEVIGRSLFDLLPPADHAQAKAHLSQLSLENPVQTFEHWVTHLNGERRYQRWTDRAIYNADGVLIEYQSVGIDITALKQTEEALRESEERLKMSLQGTQTGTWEWNIVTGETVFNERWAEIVGYTLKELSPISIQTWIDLTHPDDLNLSNQTLEKHFSGQSKLYECEVRMKHKNGEWVCVLDRGMVMEWTEEGQPLRMFGTHADITERKQAEQRQLELALERERTQILANFITQASHEFRTPLSTINTSTYLLKRTDDPQARNRHLLNIEEHVQDITTLVNALTIMTSLDSKQEFTTHEVDLCEVLESVHEARLKDFQSKSIHDMLQIAVKPLIVCGDSGYLRTAVEQIVDNAIQFTPEGGAITLRTDNHDDDAIIEIIDTGVGISEEELPRIFERFYRADKAGTTRGFGLGLPIAKRIIELHQGRIEVMSEPGKGSLFRIILPS